MPHHCGSVTLRKIWPVIRALRHEWFDRSVDFASNDRGAIAGFLVGARQRLGWAEPRRFWGRHFCYNQRVSPAAQVRHESARLARLLAAWGNEPSSLAAEIRTGPALAAISPEQVLAGLQSLLKPG